QGTTLGAAGPGPCGALATHMGSVRGQRNRPTLRGIPQEGGVMSPRVTIDFSGLCLFATKNVPERLSVLLGADSSERHRPLLSFDVRNLAGFSGRTVEQVIQMPDGTQVASWSLDKRLVTVKAGKSAAPHKVVLCGGGERKSRLPQNPLSEMDLCWVPSLKRISGKGDINPVYLSDHPVPHPGKPVLAARLDFQCGYLYSNAAVNRLSPAVAWSFNGGEGRKIEQYLADTVRLEFQADADETVQIEAVPFDGHSAETLELRPWNDHIQLTISNLPDKLPPPGMSGSTMPHFAIYYEFLKPIPNNRPTPNALEGSMHGSMKPTARAAAHVTAMPRGVHPVKCTPGQT